MTRLSSILELAAAVCLVAGWMMIWMPLGIIALAVIMYLIALAMEAPVEPDIQTGQTSDHSGADLGKRARRLLRR